LGSRQDRRGTASERHQAQKTDGRVSAVFASWAVRPGDRSRMHSGWSAGLYLESTVAFNGNPNTASIRSRRPGNGWNLTAQKIAGATLDDRPGRKAQQNEISTLATRKSISSSLPTLPRRSRGSFRRGGRHGHFNPRPASPGRWRRCSSPMHRLRAANGWLDLGRSAPTWGCSTSAVEGGGSEVIDNPNRFDSKHSERDRRSGFRFSPTFWGAYSTSARGSMPWVRARSAADGAARRHGQLRVRIVWAGIRDS